MPPGLDPETLIDIYEKVQAQEVALRSRAKALGEVRAVVRIDKDGATKVRDKHDAKPTTHRDAGEQEKHPTTYDVELDKRLVEKIKDLNIYEPESIIRLEDMIGKGKTRELERVLHECKKAQGSVEHYIERMTSITPEYEGVDQ